MGYFKLPKIEYDDSGKFDDLSPEEHFAYQLDKKGGVPSEFLLEPGERHRFEKAETIWESDEPELIAVLIPDNSGPAFCSFSNAVLGTEEELREYCSLADEGHRKFAQKQNSRYSSPEEIAEAKEKGTWIKEEGELLGKLERALKGEQVTWAFHGATRLVADSEPVLYAHARVIEKNMTFIHYNVWRWLRTFRIEDVEAELVWLSYVPRHAIYSDVPFYEKKGTPAYTNAMANAVLSTDPEPEPVFARAIRMKGRNSSRCYISPSAMFIDVDADDYEKTEYFENRLFSIEKRFDTKEELLEDIEKFSPQDINYSRIFCLMNGDG